MYDTLHAILNKSENATQQYSIFCEKVLVLFVWFDSLRPNNNLSVKQGRVFLGWSSTKLR